MTDRLKEISEEIRKLLKSKSNPKRLEALQAELKELIKQDRVSPTSFNPNKRQIVNPKETIANLIKKSNLVDFKKVLAEKQAEEFSNSIKTGSLYKELRKKN